MKNAIKRLAVLGLFLGFCSNAKAIELGASLDAFYESVVSKRTTGMTQNLLFSGVGFQANLQTVFLEKRVVSPYIGIGFGYIPSLTLKTITFTQAISLNGKSKDIQYAALEVGPEFIFSRVRWQLFLGYDFGTTGKTTYDLTDTSNSSSQSQTFYIDLLRFKVGTRVYFFVTSKFDLGIIANYAVKGYMKEENPLFSDTPINSTFTGYDIGLSLRARFL
jgi:hypothetical protein